MTTQLSPREIDEAQALYQELLALRAFVVQDCERRLGQWLPRLGQSAYKASAVNLAQYLALRQHDLRQLQHGLISWGLSSLGRSEGRVLANLDAVAATLGALLQRDDAPMRPSSEEMFSGERYLDQHTLALFGPKPAKRRTRIMCTMPGEAAGDVTLLQRLLEAGMDLIRINCAHDTADVWLGLIEALHQAEARCGHTARIVMDLAGPKLRLEEVQAPPALRALAGDAIWLTDSPLDPACPHRFSARPSLIGLAGRLQVGAAVWFDDGKAGGHVEARGDHGALVRLTTAPPKGFRVAAQKGLNVPGLELGLEPLTQKDLDDLDIVARHAHMVGFSFVQTPQDVQRLQQELAARIPKPWPGLMLKVETASAVAHLPEMIITAAAEQDVAVMIARGDLAVELGFQRLSEMQEELLWLAEAAHVPVVWATSVLDRLVRRGAPSRAEVTDAAMGQRSECVMLNKGPYLVEAVAILDDVLCRLEGHQGKKTPWLRALHAWAAPG